MSFDSIGGLLDHFLDAANYLTGFGPTKGSKALNNKTIDLVSKQFLCDGHSPSNDPYLRLLEMTDFISGMTDSYALSPFRSPAYLGERLLLYHLTGAFFVPIGILFVIRVKVSPGARWAMTPLIP